MSKPESDINRFLEDLDAVLKTAPESKTSQDPEQRIRGRGAPAVRGAFIGGLSEDADPGDIPLLPFPPENIK